MKLFLCKLIFTCAAVAEPEVTPHSDLVYGTVLYDYYQDYYSAALLQVRVAQKQGYTAGAETKFKLAEGSFAFSDEMFGYAADTFNAVDPAELTEIDELRLAFHLAREEFRIGDWEGLSRNLEKIDLGTARFSSKQRFHPEVEFMRSELALNNGDLSKARSHLELLEKNDVHRLYGLYNLGSALRAAGESEAAEAAFLDVSRVKPRTSEMLDLQQRALLAGAFLQRENGKIRKAEKILGNLPSQGRYRDLAMASFGTLSMESGDYELAARIWLSLQQQPLWTSSTASARLGLPLSLENLSREDLALTYYRSAEQSFMSRAVKLDELSQQVDDREWVRELLAVFAQGRSNPELLNRWQEQLGHTDWLEWLSAESIDSLLAQWRELRVTSDWLKELPREISAYEELADEQHRRVVALKTMLAEDSLTLKQLELAKRVDKQLAEFDALKSDAVVTEPRWLEAMATPEQMEILARLDKMYDAKIRQSPQAQANWRGRIDRLRGVVFWQIADASPRVLGKMQRAIDDVEELSASIVAQTQRLQGAEKNLESRTLVDFSEYSTRASDLAAKVENALTHREEQLAIELKRGMKREALQVQQYLLTARVAIARTLDQYAVIDEVAP